jgi:uncharacterized protein (DUF3820 family)
MVEYRRSRSAELELLCGPKVSNCYATMGGMDSNELQLLVTREMPYGKYKGKVIADLPGNYLAWFAREGFPPGELGRLLALMLEIDHNGLKHLLAPLRPR